MKKLLLYLFLAFLNLFIITNNSYAAIPIQDNKIHNTTLLNKTNDNILTSKITFKALFTIASNWLN